MAEVYDVISAFQLEGGEYARIFGQEVIVTGVDDAGDVIYVTGTCISDADSDFQRELHPDLEIELLTE